MRIDNYLMKIEKNFREKEIQSAFQLINDLKTEYPKTTRINEFFKKNNFKYKKKMKINSNEIEILYSKSNSQDIKTIVNSFLKKEPENAYVHSFLGNYYGKINELNNARICQEKAISSNPYEESFYINLATTYKFLGFLDLKIFLCAKGIFSIDISFDKSPLSIKKLLAIFFNNLKLFKACKVSILYIFFSLGSNFENFTMSLTEFVNDKA